MLTVLRALTVILVAVAMAPALAHALELPGKLRLTREVYVAVQRIYYPGFTMAGVAEPVSALSAIALLLVTPRGTAAFWLTVVAVIGLVGMQLVYWIAVHPVNRAWLEGETLGGVSAGFFGLGGARGQASTRGPQWTALRDRWEYA